jgi:hypothetical protein
MTAFATHTGANHATGVTPGSEEAATILIAFADTLAEAQLLGIFRSLTRCRLFLLQTILLLPLPAIGILGDNLLSGSDTLLLEV